MSDFKPDLGIAIWASPTYPAPGNIYYMPWNTGLLVVGPWVMCAIYGHTTQESAAASAAAESRYHSKYGW